MATATESNTITGWVITDADPMGGSEERLGWGQQAKHAAATEVSFEQVIKRTVYLAEELTRASIPADKRIKWRAYDDDGHPCYQGVVHFDWLFGEDDLAYNIDRFVMTDVGATIVLYDGKDIIRCDESKRNWVENHPTHDKRGEYAHLGDHWLPIYG